MSSDAEDPLKGKRKKIASGEMRVLIWPADGPCPVEKGQRFKVMGIVIQIHSIERRIQAGKPVQWHATYIRHEPDRVYLVRQSQPTRATHEKPGDVTLDMAERARRDGNYTSSRVAAMPMEPESVGPDWKDKDKSKRELDRQEALAEQRHEDRWIGEVQKFKARASQVLLESGRSGRDLTPLLSEIFARLAEEERLAKKDAA